MKARKKNSYCVEISRRISYSEYLYTTHTTLFVQFSLSYVEVIFFLHFSHVCTLSVQNRKCLALCPMVYQILCFSIKIVDINLKHRSSTIKLVSEVFFRGFRVVSRLVSLFLFSMVMFFMVAVT